MRDTGHDWGVTLGIHQKTVSVGKEDPETWRKGKVI